jgi:pimeloyl-ACP methyl ester carboxylesterase/tellurite resistance protein
MPKPMTLPGPDFLARSGEGMRRALEQTRILGEVMRRQSAALAPPPPKVPPLPQLPASPQQAATDAVEYFIDATQRATLFWDTMREAGNSFAEHEAAGCPPVLIFDYEMVVDGRTFPRPCNYALVRITVPEGYPPTDPRLRPFVIIDPRAGHGAGIGGFKSDSQVGVALRRGHPVYFVIFFRDPEPGQTILDITRAEGIFLETVREAHPQAPKPVVIGNCQGGWAVMMLGASQPELTGALVLNGAPLSYWAGERGRNPMRYLGGLAGGSWPAALLADLGDGKFDGANLVLNFESLSPGNTWFKKYYNLFQKADTEAERFLEFERWWGGYFLMNRDEIRWIVENLFIGDKFARGEIAAGGGAVFNMRAVRSPIVVFASAGDNITPPGQALRWIADVYRDEQEIKTLGQTIVYLMHDDIGHLGIFVSGAVALKEHSEIAELLALIDSLAPGLYEMQIAQDTGDNGWQVELVERSMADIRARSGDATNEAFPEVAKISQLNQSIYDLFVAPLVRPLASARSAELRRQMHPLRLRRTLISDRNPALAALPELAQQVKTHRRKARPDNPFLAAEQGMAESIERSIDTWRDWRDAWTETAFHAAYGWLAAWGIGGTEVQAPAVEIGPRLEAPEVRAALGRLEAGGFAEAVVRMMILLARARGAVRRNRLARSNALMQSEPPFDAMTAEARMALIREQTVIVSIAPAEALAALPRLLPNAAERRRAMALVEAVAGPEAELGDAARAMLAQQRDVLGLTRSLVPIGYEGAAMPD